MLTNNRKRATYLLSVFLLAFSVLPSLAASNNSDVWSFKDTSTCSTNQAGKMSCFAVVRHIFKNGQEVFAHNSNEFNQNYQSFLQYQSAHQQSSGTANRFATAISFTAAGLRTAYGITNTGNPTKVIAIVDANDDAAAYSNLTTYRSTNNLPTMNNCAYSALATLTTTSTPCFVKVGQDLSTNLPTPDLGWANEIDLDIQSASAICPSCSILLVEANSAYFSDLGAAVTSAAGATNVKAVSNSYGTSGDISQVDYPAWNDAAANLPIYASAGDAGFQTTASFPASSTNMIGVGGTTLAVNGSGVRSGETAWNGAGSGCSIFNAAPSWQKISKSPCGTYKAVSDISAVADPYSGLRVYTNDSAGNMSWYVYGGTSLSSPIIASLQAMQGGYDSAALATYYNKTASVMPFDVTSGNNGSCFVKVVCTAGPGWDGPTGLGSINSNIVAPSVPTITSATISGTAAVNSTLTVNVTATGTAPITYSYQWQSASTAGGSYANITNATGNTYRIAAGDQGKYIRVVVNARNNVGSATAYISAATSQVIAAPVQQTPPTITNLQISGSPARGSTLTASLTLGGSPTPTVTYQWQLAATLRSPYANIANATSSTFTIPNTSNYANAYIRVVVTATNVVQSVSSTSASVGRIR